jgi:hypothetical protein
MDEGQQTSPREQRDLLPVSRWILIALAIGIIERIIWAMTRDTGYATGEAAHVAVAVAQGRGFADAFAVGQGPTAHLLPISPTIAGGVYAIFGIQTVAAEAVLLAWALLLTLGAFWLFARAFAQAGSPRGAVIAAFAILCIAPLYSSTEAFDFRVWEGALAMTLAGAFLALLLDAEAGRRWRGFGLWLASLPALAFFVGPPVGLAAMVAWALFLWRHRRRDGLWRRVAALALALAMLIGPWTARNMVVMGHPIWLRDNVGLELAIANHPAASHPADARAVLDRRIDEIHPFASPAAYRKLQAAGGEVAYARTLGAQTTTWMRAHPADVATIWLRHLREMVLPDKGPFMTAHGRKLPVFRAACVDLLGALGLLGIAMAVARRDRLLAYLIGFVLIPVFCYLPFHPVARYLWLVYPPMTCFAADAVARLLALRTRPLEIAPGTPYIARRGDSDT